MPPIAERVRTLAATSSVARVSLDGVPCPATGGVDERGRPVLLVRPGEPLHGLREDAVVAVNLTATRRLGAAEHPRGLLEVQGWAMAVPAEEARAAAVAVAARSADEALFTALERFGEPSAPRLLRLDVAQVVYLTGHESGVLDAGEYLDAVADPLTETAERVLAHVNEAHRAQLANGVAALLGEPALAGEGLLAEEGRLADQSWIAGEGPRGGTGHAGALHDDRVGSGAGAGGCGSPGAPGGSRCGEVWLWELDRYGATVRVEESLVRFPWPATVATGHDLEAALRGLMCTC
ncbi:DUF2470 domain-containing protein [Nonomuraea rhodomycinica]|uniref:DUF2470 domain-containing protein n=1 Tax=Nonomuraea rhodomycinica TaxID=1712872 RepID=A0A7Y6IIY4_9ACTN|nr:DUF2470 domain-containing protein [Nonomuraea rhodomycinica]NUW39149.1 DUF2470 domain-containing protein [Nonomuraea rhodomycinica]